MNWKPIETIPKNQSFRLLFFRWQKLREAFETDTSDYNDDTDYICDGVIVAWIKVPDL